MQAAGYSAASLKLAGIGLSGFVYFQNTEGCPRKYTHSVIAN
jgi:hypothetical protein